MKVMFFAPYPEMKADIEQAFAERPDRDLFEYEIDLDSFPVVPDYVDADVSIVRGFAAYDARRRGIPCAELKVSDYDVVEAVDECLCQGPVKKIAFVGAFNMLCGRKVVERVFPRLELAEYISMSQADLDDMVRQAVEEGADAIIGGYAAINSVRKQAPQIITAVIKSGREAANNAISEAKAIVEGVWHEKQRSKGFSSIMNCSFQGIMALDRNGVIVHANSHCYTLLTGMTDSFLGHHVGEFFPNLPVNAVLSQGKKLLSDVQSAQGRQFLVNCVPVEGEYRNYGCVLTFDKVEEIQAVEEKIRKKLHHSGFLAKYSFAHIIHECSAMKQVISTAMNYSYANSNILIQGETGTGKELFAQSIHNSSARRNKPFVAINCSALPENLLESELFGYVEGAFTGAAKGGKKGFFEIAHTGTIFLDEVGDISPKLQSRLLRVLQEKEIIRIGDDSVVPVDVRVIAATNKDLKEAARRGEFRMDLLYRLDVLELNLPPLRQRGRDIELLLNRFVQLEQERTGSRLEGFSAAALHVLRQYDWPGNIREMRNFCERICILCQNEVAQLDDVYLALHGLQVEVSGRRTEEPHRPVESYDERQEILDALYKFRNNRSQTAEYLNIHPSTLWRKMKKYGISL